MTARARISDFARGGGRVATFVAAAAFYWGTAEAVINYFWPAHLTWWGENVLASAFPRVVFYGFVVGAGAVLYLLARAVRHLVRRGRPGARAGRGPAAAVGAAALLSNVGWLLAGLYPLSHVRLGPFSADLEDPRSFFGYWALLAVVGAGGAYAAARFVLKRRAWRPVGRLIQTLGTVGFVALVAYHYGAAALRPVPARPNVVLIIFDAWRRDAFRESLMPNVSAFAAEKATVYPRTWACASWTYPSMAATFHGRYPDALPLWKPAPRWTAPTLAEEFRDAGYDTAAFVANSVLERYTPLSQGFDHYVFWDRHPLGRWVRFYETNWYCSALRQTVVGHVPGAPGHSLRLTELVGQYLARPRRRPFFLFVHYLDPHTPYEPPPGYYLPQDEVFRSQLRSRTRTRRFAHHRLYEAECAYLDDLFANLRRSLERHPNTIVALTADHGEEFWEHEDPGHGKSVYEPATRVPLILSIPGKEPGVDDTPTSLLDLAPTLLDAAGGEIPPTMTGKSVLRPRRAEETELIFMGSRINFGRGRRPPRRNAVVCWPWKLHLRHDRREAEGEYYNLRDDPGEEHPLPEDELAGELRAKLEAWKRATKAEGPDAPALTDVIDATDLKALGYI